MADPFFVLCERLKDEVGGVARKIGVLDGWLAFQRDGQYPILPTHQFVAESLRNAHELAVLKIYHLLDANDPDDVSLKRFQTALEARIDPADQQRAQVTILSRELKRQRGTPRSRLKEYRDRKVAHPNIEVPNGQALAILRATAKDLFALVEGYQQFMHGGLNYEAEVEQYRDSFLGVLHTISVEAAQRALGLNDLIKRG